MARSKSLPEVRSVVHLHGGRTPPRATAIRRTGWCPASRRPASIPAKQDAALLFYHDHTMGINRLNIYAGMQGFFIVRDAREDALHLPSRQV